MSALMLLTRLPVPHRAMPSAPRGAEAAWAWPLAGLAVGILAVLVGAAAQLFGLPDTLVAGAILAALVAATGALHEDGLADVADGFWGGHDPARRLEIMKDSRIGSYGVIALVLSLGWRWLALTALVQAGGWGWAVPAAAMLSRAPLVAVSRALPNARGTGLSAQVGRPSWRLAGIAAALALVPAMALAGWAALLAVLWLVPAVAGCAALARARIGGQTGDVLGAAQQVGEIAVLGAFVAAL